MAPPSSPRSVQAVATPVSAEDPASAFTFSPIAAGVDDVDAERGWPPRLRAAVSDAPVRLVTMRARAGARAHQGAAQVALAHPDLPPPLLGRWQVLGCDLVRERPSRSAAVEVERVTLIDYADHRLVEVDVVGEHVCSVRSVGLHRHRESAAEVAAAVELARADPRLREQVTGLDAHGILQVLPDPEHPGEVVRCIRVVFTARDDPRAELPVDFAALVDLHRRQVVGVSEAPCAPSSADPLGSSAPPAAS